MNHDVNYYRTIQGTNGVRTQKEAQARSFRREVQRSFTQALNYEHVVIERKSEVFHEEMQVIPTIDMISKKIKMRPGKTVCLGDIVVWRGTRWLVNVLDADNQINYQGTMIQCNLCLRWQMPDGSIHEEYGWDKDSSKYALGLHDSEYMDVANFVTKVLVQINDYTLTLGRGKRFLLGLYGAGRHPLAVELTRVNALTNTYEYKDGTRQDDTGMLEFTLKETQFNDDTDNAELGIADYHEPESEAEEPQEENSSEGTTDEPVETGEEVESTESADANEKEWWF